MPTDEFVRVQESMWYSGKGPGTSRKRPSGEPGQAWKNQGDVPVREQRPHCELDIWQTNVSLVIQTSAVFLE